MIYLDCNATTPVDPEVYDAIFSSVRRDLGNPSSSHLCGRKTREVIQAARADVAELLGCDSEEICFTSGGTEANNLAILGTALLRAKGHIITSSIEHPSVTNPCRHLESLGFNVTVVPPGTGGMVDAEAVKAAVRDNTFLISIMHSNNETGVLQPIEEIGSYARGRGIIFHVDAAQSAGKIYVGRVGTYADLLTAVSHKFYGPKGVGALFIRRGIEIKPILFGAGHERGLRPGTENVPGIVGMGRACRIAKRDLKMTVAHTSRLRDMLFVALKKAIPGVQLNGHETMRLPNTLNIGIPGILSHELVERLGDYVAFSAGSACHAGESTPSAVLLNMGLSPERALSSIRLTTGKGNTEEEMSRAAALIAEATADLREKAARSAS